MKRYLAGLLVLFGLLPLLAGGCSKTTEGSSMEIFAATQIELSDNGIVINGKGAAAKGSIVTISKEGTYHLSGSLANGQIVVDSDSSAEVRLVLDGIDVTCADSAAVYVAKADNVSLVLQEGTVNYVTDGAEDDRQGQQLELTGAIYSKGNLTILGKGSLIVCGNYKHGVESKGNLVIEEGSIKVSAARNALHSKTCIKLVSGSVELEAGNDGMNGNEEITIEEGCNILIRSGDDAIHGDSQVLVKGGSITIENAYEGIEGSRIVIEGGRICLTAEDDGLNASGDNCKITISGGYLLINASGDGIDSNGDLEINGGEIYINGPVSNRDAAVDYGERSSALVNGGIMAAAGSSGMAGAMSDNSLQCSILAFMENKMAAGAGISLKDSGGNIIFEWAPDKEWQSIIISHPDIKVGETYILTAGEAVLEVVQDSQATIYGQGGMGGMGGMPGRKHDDMPEEFRGQMPKEERPDWVDNGEKDMWPWKHDDMPSMKMQ